ncbi:MAG: RNA polymerase sigma factor RpoD/SigA, partial [Balneolales bacterium]|nr:RNA polymerase sigma factor RpoD/SigA [Balneolales bacterium]
MSKKKQEKKITSTGTSNNSESRTLDQYFNEMSQYPQISVEEEVRLAEAIAAGDESARNRLVEANLRFVVSTAKKFQGQGMPLNDLIAEGNIGMIKAAERFDPTRGFKFISYAVWWIRQSILQALAVKGRIVRLPLNVIGDINKIRKVQSDLEQQLERPPTARELSDHIDATVIGILETQKRSGHHLSMDAPVGYDNDLSLMDLISDAENVSPDDDLMRTSQETDIQNLLAKLTPREATVLTKYYGIGSGQAQTLEDIGEHLDLTRERVRQIKEKALR